MKQNNYKFKALYVGAATTLLLSTVTPSLTHAINMEEQSYKIGDRDEVIILIKEKLSLIDEKFALTVEEDEDLFTDELKEKVELFQSEYDLDINGEIDETLLDQLTILIEENEVSEEIEDGNEVAEEEIEDQPEKQITTYSAVTMSATPTIFKEGMRHAQVKVLKRDLKTLGFTVPGNGTTLYGKDTAKKVKEFQKYYGLTSDGQAGPTTFNKIDSILKSPLQNGKRHSDTKKLKADLKTIGYPVPGKGTTLYGKDTETVVKKFQKEQKLVVNGIADEITLKKIAELKKAKEDPSVLKNGMRHAKVKTLKSNLKKLGFTVPGKGTTLYGTETAKKVKEFQKYYGLLSDGEAGPTTFNKIDSILKSPLQNGKRHNDTKKLKKDLKSIGYPVPGNGTTLYGKDTEAVVKKFQKDQKLVVNGIADEVTLKKIAELKKNTANPSVLENGMRHAKVKTLKANLKKIGFTVPGNGTTLFGADTEKKVKEFQKYYGLSSTGKVDSKTESKIQSILKSPLQNGKRHKDTVQLKKDLAKVGFTVKGNNTTLFGKETEKQVKAFQKKFKLVQNGIADEVTLRRLATEVKNAESKPVNKTEYTDYKMTLSAAVNEQLEESFPQTDKYRNSPAYVSANYVDNGIISGGNVNIRTLPDRNAPAPLKFKKGTTINIVKEVTGGKFEDTNIWYQITHDKKTYYVHSNYANRNIYTVNANVNVRAGTNTSSHIYGQLKKGAKVTVKNKTGSWYEFNYGAWRLPTKADLSSAMNPSNGDKFQHIRLDSLAGATATQLNKSLSGKGILANQGQAFINGAKQGKVNEAYLVSHAILETGNGSSKLANGIEVGKNKSGKATVVTSSNKNSLTNIKKVYNMYGIGAVDGDANNGGAIRAYELGWDTPKKAIEGGAKWVGEQYIHNAHKQNTLYKMRWNPRMINGFTWKQYASDINWATKQTTNLKAIYNNISKPNYHYDIAKYK